MKRSQLQTKKNLNIGSCKRRHAVNNNGKPLKVPKTSNKYTSPNRFQSNLHTNTYPLFSIINKAKTKIIFLQQIKGFANFIKDCLALHVSLYLQTNKEELIINLYI